MARFRDQLQALDRDLMGGAELSELEGHFGITLALRQGVGELAAFLQEPTGARLAIESARTDQTFVRQALEQFTRLADAFPVRGTTTR